MRASVSLLVMMMLPLAAAWADPPLHPPQLPGFRPLEPVESEVEAQIIDRTNAFRASQGLGSLSENERLTGEARAFAAFLASSGRFAHDADGRSPAERARNAGYAYCVLAENIAYEQDSRGFRDAVLAKDFVAGWEASPGHRRNMLDPEVVETGVGVVRAPDLVAKYVAVQVFGRPEALRYAFKVTNRTHLRVSYAFDGETRRLEPWTTITQSACAKGDLRFDAPGPARGATFPAEAGGFYILRPDPRGVRVEVLRGGT